MRTAAVHVREIDVCRRAWTSAQQKSNMWHEPTPIRVTENADWMLQEETMQFKRCTLEIDGPVAVIKMDRREVMNAVSMDVLVCLIEAPKFAGK
ncbi:hypothetical protein [Bradyrhizobium sp.]|jgi:hypothetical protein|uniref:hypothetical protein n=1 Tax=Bradyrhizobium sp. TaxID=376 RepID=UPI003C52DB23